METYRTVHIKKYPHDPHLCDTWLPPPWPAGCCPGSSGSSHQSLGPTGSGCTPPLSPAPVVLFYIRIREKVPDPHSAILLPTSVADPDPWVSFPWIRIRIKKAWIRNPDPYQIIRIRHTAANYLSGLGTACFCVQHTTF